MKVKGKILPALLVSFLSSIICLVFVGLIIGFFIDVLDIIPDNNYSYLVGLVILVAFPFCGAYVGFSLCYSGKLYVRKSKPALIVSALFGIIPAFLAVGIPYFLQPFECCSRHRAYDSALYELNSREKLWWEHVKISGRQFQTDAQIDREIVTGTTGGGWNTYIGADYTWTVSPTAAGGTISFNLERGVKLNRKSATLDQQAWWKRP